MLAPAALAHHSYWPTEGAAKQPSSNWESGAHIKGYKIKSNQMKCAYVWRFMRCALALPRGERGTGEGSESMTREWSQLLAKGRQQTKGLKTTTYKRLKLAACSVQQTADSRRRAEGLLAPLPLSPLVPRPLSYASSVRWLGQQ